MTRTTEFDTLLSELMAARGAYEELRTSDGPLAARAAAISRLHTLRRALAELREAH